MSNKIRDAFEAMAKNCHAKFDKMQSEIDTFADGAIPDSYVQQKVTDYVNNNSGGFVPRADIGCTAGQGSIAAGRASKAEGHFAFSGGDTTSASGHFSHAEGNQCKSIGEGSHAEGYYATTDGNYSHSEGWRTVAGYEYQHVEGQYNDNKEDSLLEVGNGETSDSRSNAMRVTKSGIVEALNDVVTLNGGASLTDMNSWIPRKDASGSNLTLEDTKAGTMLINNWLKNLFRSDQDYNFDKDMGVGYTSMSYGAAYIYVSKELELEPNTDYIFSCGTQSSFAGSLINFIKPSDSISATTFGSVESPVNKTTYTNVSHKFHTDADGTVRIVAYVAATNTTIGSVFIAHPMIEKAKPGQTKPSPWVPIRRHEIVSCGKNLFDKSKAEVSYVYKDGAKVSNSNYANTNFMSVEPNTTYFVQKTCGWNAMHTGCWMDEYKKYISNVVTDNSSSGMLDIAIHSPANARYLCLTILKNNLDSCMIEKGSTKSPYEPYQSSSVTITPDTQAPVVLKSYEGVTNIIFPSYIDVSYPFDIKQHVDGTVEAALPRIEKSGSNLSLQNSKAGTLLLNGWTKNLLKGNNLTFSANESSEKIIAENIQIKKGESYTLSWTQNGNPTTSTRNTPTYKREDDTRVYQSGETNRNKTSGRYSWTFIAEKDEIVSFRYWAHTLSEECTFTDFQLELGTFAHSYVPFEGYEVVSCGKNLFDVNNIVWEDFGVSNLTTYYKVIHLPHLANKKFYCGCNGNAYTFSWIGFSHIITNTGNTVSCIDNDTPNGRAIDFTNKNDCYLVVGYSNGNISSKLDTFVAEMKTMDIMISIGDVSVPYKPYQGISRVTITPDTQAPVTLKSYEGVTNIISPSYVDVSYPYNVAQNIVNYSLDEKLVGTWIDGKPLYQKTICEKSLGVGNNLIPIIFPPEDVIGCITHIEGVMYVDKKCLPIPYTDTVDIKKSICAYTSGSDVCIITVSSEYDKRDVFITVRYTKKN